MTHEIISPGKLRKMRQMWTDEEIERAKALWSDKRTLTQIAMTLRKTRNSVAGLLTRHGMMGSRTTGQRQPASGSPRRRSSTRTILRKTDEPQAFILATGLHVTVTDLEADMCRWPIGDPRDSDFHFCGHPSASGRSYCEHHLSRSVEKPREDSSHVRKTIPTVWLRGIAA